MASFHKVVVVCTVSHEIRVYVVLAGLPCTCRDDWDESAASAPGCAKAFLSYPADRSAQVPYAGALARRGVRLYADGDTPEPVRAAGNFKNVSLDHRPIWQQWEVPNKVPRLIVVAVAGWR